MQVLVASLICLLSLVQAQPERVAFYMSKYGGVLDLSWDKSAINLERQLRQVGFDVMLATTGQPILDGPHASKAYVIPVQNGHTFYTSVEDMNVVSSYLASGGLVIILDANYGQGEALSDFVAKSLGYEGRSYRFLSCFPSMKAFVMYGPVSVRLRSDRYPWCSGSWIVCEQLYNNAEQGLGELHLSKHADAFIQTKTAARSPWPSTLEDAKITSLYTSCLHEDNSASIVPLYFAQDSNIKVAAQVCTMLGGNIHSREPNL